jgi:hypothetical protein
LPRFERHTGSTWNPTWIRPDAHITRYAIVLCLGRFHEGEKICHEEEYRREISAPSYCPVCHLDIKIGVHVNVLFDVDIFQAKRHVLGR